MVLLFIFSASLRMQRSAYAIPPDSRLAVEFPFAWGSASSSALALASVMILTTVIFGL